MLNKAKTVKGYKLESLDGEIGTVKEFYFDDRHWVIRYLVADTKDWLESKQVLISPYALVEVNKEEQLITINLTKKQIEESPSLKSEQPVSQQFEEDYCGFFGWPLYSTGPYILLHKMNAYWRAANYLSVGQIYLYDNPLLKEPLKLSHVKPLVVGHWGTTPGQNFIYVHLNRVIKKYDLDMFYIAGPGHGGPAIVGNVYLEGTWSEIYPNVTQDEAGLKKLFKQFSFPGGISSHVAPTTPGSIHEGGELGYSLSHAFGAAFDNPDLIVACVVGDGEAETGPLATAWQSNKFLNPITDGAVLPILHLNGYKISNPTVLARIEHEELEQFLRGCGWTPYFVEGDEPEKMHQLMAATLEKAIEDIRQIQRMRGTRTTPLGRAGR
jgi:phosphoketolase